MEQEHILKILKQELAPAIGCTEPVAIAYASAKARSVLGKIPQRVQINVSRNILKNAMGVGIPGTDMAGLELAAALGIIGGDEEAVLEVLHNISQEDIERAKSYAKECIQVSLKNTSQKLYIEVLLETESDTAGVVIEGSHTNITRIVHGNTVVFDRSGCREIKDAEGNSEIPDIETVLHFVEEVDPEELSLFDECIRMNWEIAMEGMKGGYGLNTGKNIYEDGCEKDGKADVRDYAVSMAAAAADVRMSGGTLPVMTLCGSGNQGITATVPVIAYALQNRAGKETLYRALALSCLVTIHVKSFIGKLSALCGCGMGSSIGVCCALAYLQGGKKSHIEAAIQNMVATVSGIICDGAKAGCALKIASVVSSAFQCAALALNNSCAGGSDGIVEDDVEESIRNLGELGNRGMAGTDRVILDMMLCKYNQKKGEEQ